MPPSDVPLPERTAPTLVLARPPTGGEAADARSLGAVGGAPSLTAATEGLRRARLGAATLAIVAALLVRAAWALVHHRRAVPWPLDLAVIVGLCALAAFLGGLRPIPSAWLRRLEWIAFGAAALLLAIDQFYTGRFWGREDVPQGIASVVKNTVAGTFLLIFTYAVLIPNPPRAAAPLILAMAALPFLTQGLLYLVHPEVWEAAQLAYALSLGAFVENVLLMGMAAGLALYVAHVLASLRREAYEARQLNQYRLGRRLGWGGMGEVYLAEHRFLKRPCAVKLIRPDHADDPTALARFEREVRSMARLAHPNIVDIFDFGHTEDGAFYYVMEYLSGLSLEDLVVRFGPQPPGRVIYLLAQACEALGEAHAAGLIHRDLKPANVFAVRRGTRADLVKLIDFGLVKAVDTDDLDGDEGDDPAISREGQVRGTPQFMAPEQATGGRHLDHRCDLYGLGGLAYYLLTGTPPFPGETPVGVIIAQVRDPVEPPSSRRPGVPADLEAVVLRCLAKGPDDRDPDAAALRRALLACRAAAEWDNDRAAAWWKANMQGDPAGSSWPTRAP